MTVTQSSSIIPQDYNDIIKKGYTMKTRILLPLCFLFITNGSATLAMLKKKPTNWTVRCQKKDNSLLASFKQRRNTFSIIYDIDEDFFTVKTKKPSSNMREYTTILLKSLMFFNCIETKKTNILYFPQTKSFGYDRFFSLQTKKNKIGKLLKKHLNQHVKSLGVLNKKKK